MTEEENIETIKEKGEKEHNEEKQGKKENR